jgi:hypothetical protein
MTARGNSTLEGSIHITSHIRSGHNDLYSLASKLVNDPLVLRRKIVLQKLVVLILIVSITFTGIMKPAYADSSNSGLTSNNQELDNSTDGQNTSHFLENVQDAINALKGVAAGVAGVTGSSGLSGGAAIMTRLAAAGGVVGGGVVAGIGALGMAPEIAAEAMMNRTILRDDDRLPLKERKAREMGRNMANLAGNVSAAGTIAAAGSVIGLSGSGITSGLAAIGAVVGGGMGAGIALTVAAPAVATMAVGYGFYQLWQHVT